MQNDYAVERFIQECQQEAWAFAERQALRRRAVAARRTQRLANLRGWLRDALWQREPLPGEPARETR